MRKYKAQLIFYGGILVFILIGVITDSAYIGRIIGGTAASMVDSKIFIGSALLGGIIRKQKILIPVMIIYAIVISLYIYYINIGLGIPLTIEMIIRRLLAIVFIAYIFNAIVIFRHKSK